MGVYCVSFFFRMEIVDGIGGLVCGWCSLINISVRGLFGYLGWVVIIFMIIRMIIKNDIY